MISLKGSRFLISCEDYNSKVFINNGKEYEEVTNKLSEDDKTELIDDLIYAISDLVKNASKEKTEDIDLEKPQHSTKEQALWIKKYCSIKNREVYNQAIDDFADGISEILKDNVIHNMALLGNFYKIMNCINTLANQLKVKDIEHFEVIGNIFDNPELYKREKTYYKDDNDYER